MKLSYLIKPCTPVWARIIEPASPQHHSDEHNHLYADHTDCSRDNQSDINHKYHHNHTSGDPDISSIHANAGEVKPGGLFIAVKGFKADGHDYIGQAVENGASAIVVERKIDKKELAALFSSSLIKPAVVEVQDTRKAMSAIAARFYGNPSDAMVLVGVTGTNGKTTTAFIIESIFKAAGYNTGVIGTVNYRFGDKVFDNPVTTPDSIDLHRILAQMRDAGVTHVVMEVSSHAVDLHRVRNCEFDVGVFTNLTQDHLDYHKTMSAYFACKKSFFTRQLKKGKKGGKSAAVINIDDSYGVKIAAELGSKAITTAISADKDKRSITPQIFSSSIKDDIAGLTGNIHIQISNTAITNTAVNRNSSGNLSDSFSFSSKLTGQFNLENILSAAGASYAAGVSLKTIAKGIEACNGVPGRLERVEADGKEDSSVKRHVFVDYAHTPDALESILKTLKMRAPARLISVFGCGGDRDKTKRPIMGEIAYRYSDITIVTSDNPRTEEPNSIISQIVKGIEDAKLRLNMEKAEKSDTNNMHKQVIVEPDRAAALSLAVKISQPNDIIVAAGKGHETYQITAQGKIDFDDRIILKNALTILNTEKAVDGGKETQPVSKAGDGEKEPQPVPIEWSVSDITTALEISAPLGISSPVNLTLSGNSKPDLNLSAHKFSSVSTDSRTIKNGELFVALRGDRFDGHKFVFNLIEQGVKGFVVERDYYNRLTDGEKDEINKNNIYLFEVADTLKALGMLARFQRVRSGVKVVAITGSNGKTTTRKMTASIFEQHFKTLSTQGNLNNEIGVPLTLLKLSKDHDWAVVEMGMNHPGEISRLSRIACPDIAVITNTTDAHLEGLGSVEAVAMAKSEITDGMNQGSTIIINRDDPRWKIISDKADKSPNVSAKIFFGLDKVSASFDFDAENRDISVKASVSAKDILFNQDSIAFSLRIKQSDKDYDYEEPCFYSDLKINTPAPFMLNNAIAATCAAVAAHVPESSIKKGLLMFEPVAGRMKIINIGQHQGSGQTFTVNQSNNGNQSHNSNQTHNANQSVKNSWLHIIDDTYNANPGSVKAAIHTLQKLSTNGESIAVLGDMLELGEKSGELHFQIGKIAAEYNISRLYVYGDMASEIVKGAQYAGFAQKNILHGTKEEIVEAVLKYIQNSEYGYPDTNTAENMEKIEQQKKSIWILIKGSRGMRMESIVEALTRTFNC